MTYFSPENAINAQGALHEKQTSPGMNRAIQVKPADSENRGEVVSIVMKSMFLVSPSQQFVVPQQQQEEQQQQQSVCSTSEAC